MIRPQLRKQDIDRDGSRMLGGQFANDSAVDMPRPIEPITAAEQAVVYRGDALVIDKNEPEVCRDARVARYGKAGAPVVCFGFEFLDYLVATES